MTRYGILSIFLIYTCSISQTYDLDLLLRINPELPGSQINAHKIGQLVSQLGDINGDGYDDWAAVLSQAKDYETALFTGKVIIFYGKAAVESETPADYTLSSPSIYHGIGPALATAGDVNNDGYDDFMIQQTYTDSVHRK